jgi:hypothetical protein
MNWKDLSWKQYHDLIINMDDGGDNLDYVSIIYSIPLTELKQRPVKEVMDLIKSIGFISDLPDKKSHKVESILGINLPNDIGNWPFGLIEDIKALTMQVVSASNQTEVMRANYPLIVACAYQYMKVGQYNSTEAKKYVSDIESLPWMDIYSIVDFFFLKSIGLELGMKQDVLTTITNKKKSKQALKTLWSKWVYWLRSKL